MAFATLTAPLIARRFVPARTGLSLLRLALSAALLASICLPLRAQQLPVQVAPLRSVVVHPWREVPADTHARNVTTLAAEVGGTLQRWLVDVGQQVRKGQTLAQIDPQDLQLARQQAQAQVDNLRAQLALAQRQGQRAQDLAKQGFFSQEALNQNTTQIDVLRAQLRAAQVQVQLTQRQLDKTQVRAPFDAEVTARMAQAGAAVGVGAPLFTLAESQGVQLHAQLSSAQAQDLRQAPSATWESANQRVTLQPRQLRVASAMDAQTRTLALRVNMPADVPPGRSGRLRWQSAAAHLPAEALVRRQGQLGVFVVQQQVARFHALHSAQEGQAVAVDLPPETIVVTQGQQRLQDGDAVTATPKQP